MNNRTSQANVGLPIALMSALLFLLLTVASPMGTFWYDSTSFLVPMNVTQELSLAELIFVIESDFLAFGVLMLFLPAFEKIFTHESIGVRVKHALSYITYVIEPRFKKFESILLYLA